MAYSNSPKETYVEINGVDVTNYVTAWIMEEEWSEVISTIKISVSRKIDSVITLTNETPHYEVLVQRGPITGKEVTKFWGYLVNHVSTVSGYDLICMDKYWEARQREANTSFDRDIDPEAGVVSEIFKTLIDDFTPNLSYSSTSIQNSGTTYTLKKFVCNHAEVFERHEELAKAINWQHYYNSRDNYVYFEPRGYVSESIILQIGANVVNNPEWAYKKDKMYNKLTIIGAEQDAETTEFFSGDGTTTKFTLTYTPTSMKVFVGNSDYDPYGTGTKPSDNPNNLKIGGKQGSTSGSYDYSYDDDPKVRAVTFQSSSVPSSHTNNIEIQYTYKLPTPIQLKDLTSISTYGVIEKTITTNDVKTVADAEVYGRNLLSRYSQPFVYAELEVVGEEDIRAGRTYRVIDANNNIDRYLLVLSVKSRYPYRPDEIAVGDEILRSEDWEVNVLDRIKRLEEAQGKTTDLLIQVFDFNEEVLVRRRCFELYKKNIAGDTLLWGNESYGTWGSFKWGNESTNSFILGSSIGGVLGTNVLGSQLSDETLAQIIPGDNDFREYLYDEKFIDTSNSEITVDTTNNKIEYS